VWAFEFIGIAGAWWIRWRRIRAAVRAGSPVQLEMPIRAMMKHPNHDDSGRVVRHAQNNAPA